MVVVHDSTNFLKTMECGATRRPAQDAAGELRQDEGVTRIPLFLYEGPTGISNQHWYYLVEE